MTTAETFRGWSGMSRALKMWTSGLAGGLAELILWVWSVHALAQAYSPVTVTALLISLLLAGCCGSGLQTTWRWPRGLVGLLISSTLYFGADLSISGGLASLLLLAVGPAVSASGARGQTPAVRRLGRAVVYGALGLGASLEAPVMAATAVLLAWMTVYATRVTVNERQASRGWSHERLPTWLAVAAAALTVAGHQSWVWIALATLSLSSVEVIADTLKRVADLSPAAASKWPHSTPWLNGWLAAVPLAAAVPGVASLWLSAEAPWAWWLVGFAWLAPWQLNPGPRQSLRQLAVGGVVLGGAALLGLHAVGLTLCALTAWGSRLAPAETIRWLRAHPSQWLGLLPGCATSAWIALSRGASSWRELCLFVSVLTIIHGVALWTATEHHAKDH